MDKKLAAILISSLGLNQKEAKIYLALLELGEASVQEIAKTSGIKRTSIYFIIEDLKKKGLALEIKSKKHVRFMAEDPKNVLASRKGRLGILEKHIGNFEIIKNKNTKPRVFFFDNAEGFKKIWEMLFRSGAKEYLIMTDPREMLGFVQKGYITGKIIKEKTQLGIKSRQIIASSEYAKEIVAKDAKENRVSKILPHIYKIPFTTIVFGANVALISPQKENLILLFESEEFAKTQRSVFEALWESGLLIK